MEIGNAIFGKCRLAPRTCTPPESEWKRAIKENLQIKAKFQKPLKYDYVRFGYLLDERPDAIFFSFSLFFLPRCSHAELLLPTFSDSFE